MSAIYFIMLFFAIFAGFLFCILGFSFYKLSFDMDDDHLEQLICRLFGYFLMSGSVLFTCGLSIIMIIYMYKKYK